MWKAVCVGIGNRKEEWIGGAFVGLGSSRGDGGNRGSTGLAFFSPLPILVCSEAEQVEISNILHLRPWAEENFLEQETETPEEEKVLSKPP